MAYRLDSGLKGPFRRRMAICTLSDDWQINPGSITALSDTIQSGGELHYDPRFLVFQDRLFIHYNNNMLTRPNQIYLVELDTETLCAKGPARPLVLEGPRQLIEKNWMLFEHEGNLLAVYSIAPHVILQLSMSGDGPIICTPTLSSTWNVDSYSKKYGNPSGGAPPVRFGDLYLSVFHSQRPAGLGRFALPLFAPRFDHRLPDLAAAINRRMRRLCMRQRRYFGGLYAFDAEPPFTPRWMVPNPILFPDAELPRQRPRWSDPSSELAVYPTGAILLNEKQLLVSYGVHEERCCLRVIELDRLN